MATRTTPGIGKGSDSNVAGINKAAQTVSKYVGNVGKEYSEWKHQGTAPARNAQAGQFWGAVLMAARYDAKGKRIKG